MKSMLMAIMAVAVAVTFSAPAFAGDEPTKKKPVEGKYTDTYEEPKKPAEDVKKPKFTDTFGDEMGKDKKPAPAPAPGK